MAKHIVVASSVLAALGSWGYPTVKKALATPEPFTAWLRTLPLRMEAGITKKSSKCPLAVFVKAVTGVDLVMVSLTDVSWMDERRQVHLTPTETWAQEFLVALDATGDRAHKVSAADCLAVLTKLEKRNEQEQNRQTKAPRL